MEAIEVGRQEVEIVGIQPQSEGEDTVAKHMLRGVAIRIIRSHPQWPDRLISLAPGLAPGAITEIYRTPDAEVISAGVRISQNSCSRATNSAIKIFRAIKVFRWANPYTSLYAVSVLRASWGVCA